MLKMRKLSVRILSVHWLSQLLDPKRNLVQEDKRFYQFPTGINYYFFSSNSCNFITATNRAKTDCPKGYVFCNITSKPLLADEKMIFNDAVDHCERLFTTICKLNIIFMSVLIEFFRFARKFWWCGFRIRQKKYNENIEYHLDGLWTSRYDEIQVNIFLKKWQKSLSNLFFRSKSTGRFLNASQICLSDRSVFYNTVLSHGDGSIKNYPSRNNLPDVDLCSSQDLSNYAD